MIIILCSLTGGLIYYSYKKIYKMADYSLRDIMLLFNIGFGMLAALGFMLPPLIFILGQTNIRPRDWWIGYMIVFGVDWLYYTSIMFGFLRSTLDDIMTEFGMGASPGTYRRFVGFYTIKTFTFLSNFIIFLLWFMYHTGPLKNGTVVPYLYGAETPTMPRKSEPAYISFFSVNIVYVFYFFVNLVYNILLTIDLWEIETFERVTAENLTKDKIDKFVSNRRGSPVDLSKQKPQDPALTDGQTPYGTFGAPGSRRNVKQPVPELTAPPAVPQPRKNGSGPSKVNDSDAETYHLTNGGPTVISSRSKQRGYFAFTAILYLSLFVIILVFFIHSFQIKSQLPLYLIVGFLSSATVGLVGVLWFYYDNKSTSMISILLSPEYDTENMGHEVHFYLVKGHIVWIVFIALQWLCLIYYWTQEPEFDFHIYPHFNTYQVGYTGALIQTNEWYIWNFQAIFSTACFPVWADCLVSVIFATRLMPFQERIPTAFLATVSPTTGLAIGGVFYWVAILTVYTFSLSAIMSSTWLAVDFESWAISYSVIGAVFVFLILLCDRYRPQPPAVSPPSVGTSQPVNRGGAVRGNFSYDRLQRFLSEANAYLSQTLTMHSWRVVVVLPLAWFIIFVSYWVTFGNYSNTFHSEIIKTVVSFPLPPAPINGLSYYWYTLNTVAILVGTSFLILVIEWNANMLTKVALVPHPNNKHKNPGPTTKSIYVNAGINNAE
jgi:hypothetical protein